MIGLFKCISRDATGAVNFVSRTAELANSLMRQGQQGWAIDSTGAGYTEDAGSAVPSTAIRSQGVAFTPDGALYTTNTAPAVGASRICGFAVRSDGALHIGGSDLTIGARIQGVAISTDGRVISGGTPWNLAYVDRYWDARYFVTAAATRVSNWLDMKLSTDMPQASGAAQPVSDGSSITFDGAAYFLKAAPFTLNQPATIVLAFKQVTWTNQDYVFDGNANNSGVLYQNSATPQLNIFAGSATGANTGLAVNTYGIAAVTFNGASSALQINLGAPVTGDAGATNMSGFTLAAQAAGNQNGNIQVKAVAICNSALSPANLNQLISAMAAQYGITL